MRGLVLLLGMSVSWSVAAADRITPQLVQAFIDQQSTAVMQKDIDRLMSLVGSNYTQSAYTDTSTQQSQSVDKAELKKIYNSNFIVAKLIINKIDILDSHIAPDGTHGQLKTQVFTRYLIEFQGKQNILTQEEEWLSDIGLENGNVVYLRSQKRPVSHLSPPNAAAPDSSG